MNINIQNFLAITYTINYNIIKYGFEKIKKVILLLNVRLVIDYIDI